MNEIVIRAEIEFEQRHELLQMCKSWLTDPSSAACLERRIYEDAVRPTHLMLIERWSDRSATASYLISERFRALIGAIKVLGNLVDVRVSEPKVIEQR